MNKTESAAAPAAASDAPARVAALPAPPPPSAATGSKIARMCDDPEMTEVMRRSLIDEHKAALLTQLREVNFSISDHDRVRQEYAMWSGIAAKGDGPLPCDVIAGAARRQVATAPVTAPVSAESSAPVPAAATETAGITAPAPAAPATTAVPTESSAAPGEQTFGIQLAAVRSEQSAESEWRRLKGAHADLLGSLGLSLEPVTVADKGEFFRIQARSMSKVNAERLCGELKGRGVNCLVVRR